MIAKAPIAWAKITGQPQPGFTKSQLEWSFDLGVTDDVLEVLKAADVSLDKYIKPAKHPKTGKIHALNLPYIKFSRKEIKADGSEGKPYKIVDRFGQPWDPKIEIGNGSLVNVKFATNVTQNGDTKPSAIAIQVWELVEREAGDDDFPVAEGEEW